MFTHVLVPLDGSKMAEEALPAAAYLARISGARVTLVHVIEKNAPKAVHSERHLTNPEEAQQYLRKIAEQSFPQELEVEWHVHTSLVSDVARSIVAHVEELHHDLVVMCTHGGGGARDWLFGNIAQQVIGLGQTPVLLIHPEKRHKGEFTIKRILVPLDGNNEHEQGLPVAMEMAEACQLQLHLLMVVPTFSTLYGEHAASGRLLPGATQAVLELAEMGGQEYLRRHVAGLNQKAIHNTAEVARGDPSRTIAKVAGKVKADLIILGTHGKSGMDAFWSGSVPPKVSSHSKVPVLLVPVVES